jgi:choline dehydrogenase-like flavoprotein
MSAAFDAIVVGAGAGGAAAAWRLASQGCRVLVLEAGPWFDPDKDYGLGKPDWESRFFPTKKGSAGRHRYGEMQVLDPQWDDLRGWHHEVGWLVQGDRRVVRGGYSHVRGVGGSTLHYIGEAHRLNPHAMKLSSEHGVGADWPFEYADLEPYYVEAERLIGVAGPVGAVSPVPCRHMPCRALRARWGWALRPLACIGRPMPAQPCPKPMTGVHPATTVAAALAAARAGTRDRSIRPSFGMP